MNRWYHGSSEADGMTRPLTKTVARPVTGSDPGRAFQWARWGILLAAVITGSALTLTAWSSYVGARDISQTLARGHGESLHEGLRGALRALDGPPRADDVDDLLAAFAGQGLRYLAILGPAPVEAGTPLGPSALTRDPLPPGSKLFLLRDLGGRIRVAARPPGPPHRGARHAPRLPHGPHESRASHPPAPGHHVPPPPMVFELEPIYANQLVQRAERSAWISTAVAWVLLCAAAIAFRWLQRRARLEQQRARERHLATLGEMSAVLAHELRNPLASLKGHAQLLAEVLPPDRPEGAKAARVVREALRLEQLTTGLLDFVRTGAIHRAEVDPARILHAAVADAGATRVTIHAGSAPASWWLDADRMQQVLVNLLQNAVQASPADAAPDIAIGTGIEARIDLARGRLVYEIRDRGPGLAAGDEEAIFQPFHTGRTRGTGLGLAVAKRVVELHGGSIRAGNHPDGGALFHIEIPGAR